MKGIEQLPQRTELFSDEGRLHFRRQSLRKHSNLLILCNLSHGRQSMEITEEVEQIPVILMQPVEIILGLILGMWVGETQL